MFWILVLVGALLAPVVLSIVFYGAMFGAVLGFFSGLKAAMRKEKSDE
jgi:hypothetical protein